MNNYIRFVICLLLVVVLTACNDENSDGHNPSVQFEYPVNASSEEWSSYQTRSSMVAALRIPEEILIDLTTERLVELVFEFPLLGDLIAHNSTEIALSSFENDCDAFRELANRDEAAKILSNYIANLPEDSYLEIMAAQVLMSSKTIFGEN
ncbi:MAG: hypothetical protein ABII85_06050 [Bacillota bacterium]